MDQRSLERIRKRERDDDDDELFFFILPALYLYLKNTEKTKRHSSITYGRRKVMRLLNGHLKDCLTTFRMEPEIFRWIASYLRNEGLILDSDTIKVEEKLAFFCICYHTTHRMRIYRWRFSIAPQPSMITSTSSLTLFPSYQVVFWGLDTLTSHILESQMTTASSHTLRFHLFLWHFKRFFSYLIPIITKTMTTIPSHCRTV